MKTTFRNLEINDYFLLNEDCGIIEMQKLNSVKAKCMASCDPSYLRGETYCVLPDSNVIKTNTQIITKQDTIKEMGQEIQICPACNERMSNDKCFNSECLDNDLPW